MVFFPVVSVYRKFFTLSSFFTATHQFSASCMRLLLLFVMIPFAGGVRFGAANHLHSLFGLSLEIECPLVPYGDHGVSTDRRPEWAGDRPMNVYSCDLPHRCNWCHFLGEITTVSPS